MGIFRRIIDQTNARRDSGLAAKISPRLPKKPEIKVIVEQGAPKGPELDVVGEGQPERQRALERLAGGRSDESAWIEVTAQLVAEPKNKYDPLAVKVVVNGKHVGYLARGTNREWSQRCQRSGPVACQAVIVGGWDRDDGDRGHFGIRVWAPA